jgi:hypothetical protein
MIKLPPLITLHDQTAINNHSPSATSHIHLAHAAALSGLMVVSSRRLWQLPASFARCAQHVQRWTFWRQPRIFASGARSFQQQRHCLFDFTAQPALISLFGAIFISCGVHVFILLPPSEPQGRRL